MARFLVVMTVLISASWSERAVAQSIGVDHVFVFVSPNAPEARKLRDAGFVVMQDTSRHTGQGTASLSVKFRNAYLELIWVDDPEEFQRVGLGMPERRGDPAGSPFGIGLKRTDREGDMPFPTDPYTADWMGDSEPIQMATWSGSIAEPLIFVVPDGMQWDIAYERVPQLERYTRHELEVRNLTELRLVGPNLAAASPTLAVLADLGVIQVADGFEHTMHLTFDDGEHRGTVDLRPTLPVVLHY